VSDENPVTLEFEADNSAGGSSGCNSYSTTYTIDNGTIMFSEITSTRRACSDELNEQERLFFEALTFSDAYEVTGEQLTISYHDGQQLVFVPLDSSEQSDA
jgi:heat shock protein HslJ